jgi:hypothetical protein
MKGYYTVAGVQVRIGLLSMKKAQKWHEGDWWLLRTVGGETICQFASEERLDEFWRRFHAGRNRRPIVTSGNGAVLTSAEAESGCAEKGCSTPMLSNGSSDFRMPHSIKWDIPEYDTY